jgi:uncharacterized protein (TIGR02246 family)
MRSPAPGTFVAMRTILSIVAFSIASLAFAQAENAALRAEITALYTRWDKAAMAGNVPALMAMLTGDFTSTDLDGKVQSKADAKAHMEFLMKTYAVGKLHTKIDQVQPSTGDEAVAWITMTVEFKARKDGKPGKFTGRFAETVRRVDGRWLFAASQQLP